MVACFIQHGNHSRGDAIRSAPIEQVAAWYRENGYELETIANDIARDFDTTIPFVENLIGSTWFAMSEGSEMQVSIMSGDTPLGTVVGPGEISTDYEAKFEHMCRCRDRAVTTGNRIELETAYSFAVASIEAFLTHCAIMWNTRAAPDDQIDLTDRSPFDKRFKKIMKTVGGGTAFDCSKPYWQIFNKLKGVRDDMTHSKSVVAGGSLRETAEALNQLGPGPATLMLNMHIFLGMVVPSKVIRAVFYPKIEAQIASMSVSQKLPGA